MGPGRILGVFDIARDLRKDLILHPVQLVLAQAVFEQPCRRAGNGFVLESFLGFTRGSIPRIVMGKMPAQAIGHRLNQLRPRSVADFRNHPGSRAINFEKIISIDRDGRDVEAFRTLGDPLTGCDQPGRRGRGNLVVFAHEQDR